MPRPGFFHHHCKAASAKAETLLDPSGDSYLAAISRNTVALADHPHMPGAVINLKKAIAQRAKGIGYVTSDCDLFSGVASGVAVDVGNAYMRRAADEKKRGGHNCQSEHMSKTLLQVRLQKLPNEDIRGRQSVSVKLTSFASEGFRNYKAWPSYLPSGYWKF
jgi:hypothetical protein